MKFSCTLKPGYLNFREAGVTHVSVTMQSAYLTYVANCLNNDKTTSMMSYEEYKESKEKLARLARETMPK